MVWFSLNEACFDCSDRPRWIADIALMRTHRRPIIVTCRLPDKLREAAVEPLALVLYRGNDGLSEGAKKNVFPAEGAEKFQGLEGTGPFNRDETAVIGRGGIRPSKSPVGGTPSAASAGRIGRRDS